MSLFGLGGLAGLFTDRPLARWLLNEALIVVAFIFILAVAWLPAPCRREHGRVAEILAALVLVKIAQHQNGVVVKILEFALIRWIGLISDGAYLFHPVIRSGAVLSWLGVETPGVSLDSHRRFSDFNCAGLAVLARSRGAAHAVCGWRGGRGRFGSHLRKPPGGEKHLQERQLKSAATSK